MPNMEPTLPDILYEFVWLAIRNWWFVAVGSVVAVIKAIEWFRGKQFAIPARWRVALALGVLLIAEFMAYMDLRLRTSREERDSVAKVSALQGAMEILRATIAEKDRKITDLQKPQVGTKPGWVADLPFSNGDNFTEINGQEGRRHGVFMLVSPAEAIRPPHTLRLEFNRAVQIGKVFIDQQNAYDLKWIQNAPTEIEITFSGPSMKTDGFHIAIYAKDEKVSFEVLRLFRRQGE